MWEDGSAEEVERAVVGEEGEGTEEEEEEEETRDARDERIPAHLRPPSKLPPRLALPGSSEGGPLIKRSPASRRTLHTEGDQTISYTAADARERLPAAVLFYCASTLRLSA